MKKVKKTGAPALQERPEGYGEWLATVKARVHAAQQRAALAVNHELLALYWGIGRDILERQAREGWGSGVVQQVSTDLRAAFPEMKGFSRANLMYMRAFAEAWPEPEFVQLVVGQIPWGHNLVLLTQLKDREKRLEYAANALEYGWSRAVLVHHIEQRTVERKGKAFTNFGEQLPKPQSDLARETLKDPYRFDFLRVGTEATEREIEGALVQHMTKFLLEPGAGFAFVGRQVLLDVGGDEFFIDLLFYHLKLRCYVVIELKSVSFKPEQTGQLGFYLTAINEQVKAPEDAPTIGLLLCKSKNKVALAEHRTNRTRARRHRRMMFVNCEMNSSSGRRTRARPSPPSQRVHKMQRAIKMQHMLKTQLRANSQQRNNACTSQRLVRTRPFVFLEGRGAAERDGSVDCCTQLMRGQAEHQTPKGIWRMMRVFENEIVEDVDELGGTQ